MNEGSEIRKGGNAWWIVAGVVLGLVVMPFIVLYLWGMFLPDDYEVTVSGTVAVPPETLFQTVADPESQAAWRPGVTRGEVADPMGDMPVVIMHTGDTKLTLVREAATPNTVVMWSVVPSRKQVFEGSWTYALAPEGDGTRLTVTEQGTLTSPFARAATQAFFGLDTYSKANLRALGRHHQVEVTIDE